jgi:O-antigen/teichoic acid export membrane protein
MKTSQDIAQRTITSVGWQTASNAGRIVVSFVRTTLLARWLPVEVFGVFGLAHSWVVLSSQVASFGMGGAFLHRAPETEDEEQAAAIHFTLKLLLTLAWACCMVVGALLFAQGSARTALMVLTATAAGIQLTKTPEAILHRRVVHRRLALLELTGSISISIVALTLARGGATLWALLSMEATLLLVRIIMLYVWRPVWRPRLAWSPRAVRYFLDFGARNLLAQWLARALDRVDDLWTGMWLGDMALGFYSRAYEFATYPRNILSRSINVVTTGTYAELKRDRLRLSKAFFRVNAFLIRSGFLLAGLMVLAAPEFIRLVLGEKWLPMLLPFRLMLLYTLFVPIKVTVADLFIALGEPQRVVKARGLQLAVLAVGLFSLGPLFDIAGVAVAVDLMLIVGIGLMLWWARSRVDYSLRRMLVAPGAALTAGLLLALGVSAPLASDSSPWLTGLVKVAVFSLVYGAALTALEGRELLEMGLTMLRKLGFGFSSEIEPGTKGMLEKWLDRDE